MGVEGNFPGSLCEAGPASAGGLRAPQQPSQGSAPTDAQAAELGWLFGPDRPRPESERGGLPVALTGSPWPILAPLCRTARGGAGPGERGLLLYSRYCPTGCGLGLSRFNPVCPQVFQCGPWLGAGPSVLSVGWGGVSAPTGGSWVRDKQCRNLVGIHFWKQGET